MGRKAEAGADGIVLDLKRVNNSHEGEPGTLNQLGENVDVHGRESHKGTTKTAHLSLYW